MKQIVKLQRLRPCLVLFLLFLVLTLLISALPATSAPAKTILDTVEGTPSIKTETAREAFAQTIDEVEGLLTQIDERLRTGEDTSSELLALDQKSSTIKDLDRQVRKEFLTIEQECRSEGFANIILDRHQKVVSDYEYYFEELMPVLDALLKPKKKIEHADSNGDTFEQSLARARNLLAEVDGSDSEPRNIIDPTHVLSIAAAPRFEIETFSSAKAEALTQLTSDPTIIDLEPTVDAQITEAIIELASSLSNSTLKIYEYVKDNFEYQPYYGSIKGSEATLLQVGGNDYDLSSLLIALLRASDVPSRYVQGTVQLPIEQAKNWLGVEDGQTAGNILATAGIPAVLLVSGPEIVALRFEHVWVEAYVPYTNYRGIPGDDTGKMWIPLDPTFKSYEYNTGIDIPSEMGFDAEVFVDDYISTFHEASPVEMYVQDIQGYIAANYPELSYDDVLRFRIVSPESLGLLPCSLPYKVISQDDDYSEIPSARRHEITFHLHDWGSTLIDYTTSLPEITGKQVTISYVAATPDDQAVIDSYGGLYQTPPYLVYLKPVLKINGSTVAEGSYGIGMGITHESDMYFTAPAGVPNPMPVVYNNIICGTYQGIGIDTWSVPWQTFMNLEEGTVPDTDGLTGNKLWRTAMRYLDMVDRADIEVERSMHLVVLNWISEAIVENAISVSYDWWGTPWTFDWCGLRVDADRKIVSPFDVNGGYSKWKQFMVLTGADGSISENRLFEDEYEENAVSAIKILELASDAGITIYKIDSSNIGTILPLLNLPSFVISAVSDSVSLGRVVTVPQAEIQYGSLPWQGVGYIDMDPVTGAAGYIISGGISGGDTVDIWISWQMVWFTIFKDIVSVEADIQYPDPPNTYYYAYVSWWAINPALYFEVIYTIHYDDGSTEIVWETYIPHYPYPPGYYTFYAGWGAVGPDASRNVVVFGVNIDTPDGTYAAKSNSPITLEAEVVPAAPPGAIYNWTATGAGQGTLGSPNSQTTEFTGTDAGLLTVNVGVTKDGQVTSDSTGITVFSVDVTGPASVEEGLDSDLFTADVTPYIPAATYKWIWEAPPGAGNNPEVKFSGGGNQNTARALNSHWFANPNTPWIVDNFLNCNYTINVEVTVGTYTAKDPAPPVLHVAFRTAADGSLGETSVPTFAGSVATSTRIVGGKTEWYVSGQGNFQRTDPLVTIHLPSSSQFYNKTLAHENYHVTQLTSIAPWQNLWDANKLYNDVLSTITSQGNKTDLEQKIATAINARRVADNITLTNTMCDIEWGAWQVGNAVPPPYLNGRQIDIANIYSCSF